MAEQQVIAAELTFVGDRFESGVSLTVGADGIIQQVARSNDPVPPPTRRLLRRALLPGFVNVHSHAFQRALRGLGETYPAGLGDFWTWREAMYGLVQRLTPEEFVGVTRQAFEEMISCGITTVGEFHYLHHREPADGDFELDALVLQAARESGIRLVLLESFYKTGGFNRPLSGGQMRFGTPDVNLFLQQVERLTAQLDRGRQSIGIAPHSLRAVPVDDLLTLHRAARERDWMCHIHVEEQRQEISDCRAALGVTPLEWILHNLPIGPELTIIHATHSTAEMLKRYVSSGANVCVCPLTEGNLGDGLGDVAAMLTRPDAVCFGSDSNVRIDAIEELRWLEFTRRLRHERRGVCKPRDGDLARQLFACGTRNGARALGLTNVGAIEAGMQADLIGVDLDHPSLAGTTPQSLLAALLLGSSGACIREVCIGGRWRR